MTSLVVKILTIQAVRKEVVFLHPEKFFFKQIRTPHDSFPVPGDRSRNPNQAKSTAIAAGSMPPIFVPPPTKHAPVKRALMGAEVGTLPRAPQPRLPALARGVAVYTTPFINQDKFITRES
jgi:hypothetical protein